MVHALAIGHQRLGHNVQVLAVVGPGGEAHPFLKPLNDAGVRAHALTLPARAYFAERRFVRALCTAERFDIVHTHGYRPDVLDAGVARKVGIPTVTTEHGMSKMGGRTRLYEWLQHAALRRFDRIVAVSRPIEQTLVAIGVRRDRIIVVPNAWVEGVTFETREAARRRLGLEATTTPVIGWIGRLITAKGADLFLEALRHLADLPLTAVIVGDGPERSRLEQLTGRLGLAGRGRFCGIVRGAGALMRAFDLFALTSRTEGTPVVLLEAMAAGVPIAVTMVGGVPDVVSEREAATAPPGQPDALAAALRVGLEDSDRARQRVQAAMLRLREGYGLGPWLRKYEDVYRTLLIHG